MRLFRSSVTILRQHVPTNLTLVGSNFGFVFKKYFGEHRAISHVYVSALVVPWHVFEVLSSLMHEIAVFVVEYW